MAGTFILGEQKVRPGAYFTIQKKGTALAGGTINGVTAVVFKADFGPLNTAVEISAEEGYESIYGNGLTTDAIKEAIMGGAKTIIACRAGNGGTQAVLEVEDTARESAVTITAKYPGEKAFTATIRQKLTDETKKECIIYSGTAEFERVEFAAGASETTALAAAMAASNNFSVQVVSGKESAILAETSQKAFTKGTNPTVESEDYSNAFQQVEAYEFNTICVDTEDTNVHLLLAAFVNRIFETGSLAMAVVAEKHTENLNTRMAHAAAFNDHKMHYVLNAYINEQGKEIDGYQTAARIAGMIGAAASNSSLTHSVIPGFSEILERLTNAQMIEAEKKGCLVFSYNNKKQVWIDNAINTLVTPTDDYDEGWKKIRRTKTRFELIRRINAITDELAGRIDNDNNGRKTVISQMQGVGIDMISESKLISCTITESNTYKADGDNAWFDIDVIDKDSMEHIYLTYKFQFSTNQE